MSTGSTEKYRNGATRLYNEYNNYTSQHNDTNNGYDYGTVRYDMMVQVTCARPRTTHGHRAGVPGTSQPAATLRRKDWPCYDTLQEDQVTCSRPHTTRGRRAGVSRHDSTHQGRRGARTNNTTSRKPTV